MLILHNGKQKYSITFQHYPTKQERDEYRERCAKALAEGKPAAMQPDFADAAKTQAVLAAASESARTRKWVGTQ